MSEIWSKLHIGLYVQYRLFLGDFKVTWIFTTYVRNIKFHEKPSNGSRVVPCGQMDGQTDMTKLTITFRNFANAPKHTMRSEKDPARHRTLYLQTSRSNRAISKTRMQTLCNQRSHNQQSRYSQLALTKHAPKQMTVLHFSCWMTYSTPPHPQAGAY